MKIMIHNIKLVVNNTLQKKHINYSRLTGVIVVSALIFVSLLRPVLASAPLCMDGIMSLQAELDMSFSDRNDPGLHERRNRLRNLFERQTPTCAKKIRRLIDTPSSGGLAKQFQHKLATHTRVELLAVLDKRILATPKVDIDGEIEITTKPTKEQFVRTTRRAKDILNAVNFNNISVSDVEGIRRMKCVIKMMIAEGPSIDDTYYPVAPFGVAMLEIDNPLNCSKVKKGGTVQCRETEKDVIDSCQISLSEKLVQAAFGSDKELLNSLLNIDDSIARGLAYFSNLHAMGNANALFCSSEIFLFKRMKTKVHRDISIYNCYTDIKL